MVSQTNYESTNEIESGGVFLHATSKNSPSKQTITSYKQGSYSHLLNAMHSLLPLYNTNRAFFWSGTGAAGSPYLLSGQDSLIRQTARRWLREMNICCLWIPSLCCADVTADHILDEVKSNQGGILVVTKLLNTGSFRAQGFYRNVVVPWGVPGDYLNINPGHFRNTRHSLKAWCKYKQNMQIKMGECDTDFPDENSPSHTWPGRSEALTNSSKSDKLCPVRNMLVV